MLYVFAKLFVYCLNVLTIQYDYVFICCLNVNKCDSCDHCCVVCTYI